MDVENLKANQDFSELPETYTIFITEHDIFHEGKPFYPIERINMVTHKLFEDGEHILYVNGAYRGDSEIGRLMHDFCCWNPEDMHNPMMRDVARYYKENLKGVESMCEAFEQTRYENTVRIALNMIELGRFSLEDIAIVCELPLEKVQELAKQKGA